MRSLTIVSDRTAGRTSVSRYSFPTLAVWIAEGSRQAHVEFDRYDLGDWWNSWNFGSGRKALVTDPSWEGPAYQTTLGFCKMENDLSLRLHAGQSCLHMVYQIRMLLRGDRS